ncbi:glycoside hydrolase family 2 TIM barrel-domain containing protein [Desulfosarcina cetonica]|uniref:glycoside hydrolase family 2 TIM barrel-domain containing protein n=1 Tax=Desulfosarcina cetonica TaxID=90730 RepID=UPI001FF01905|nr:glycoside hydrolase family 2 TIM barrel-domain containing protein [Desulfosarcina cetonica]
MAFPRSSDYRDPAYRQRKRDDLSRLLAAHRNHPALLMWALGNEINLQGADTPEAWRFVDELAQLIKRRDPHHPVISVIASGRQALENIAAYAPTLDAVGINAYGTLSDVRAMIDTTAYQGPYIVTEWGVNGHWEVRRTDWGRPIEPASAKKVEYHIKRYRENILSNRDRCIGSYVFLWGQKQERTPTWYSMFIENLPGDDPLAVACPTVDAMHFNWSGLWPANRAPFVAAMTINDTTADSDITLMPGEAFVARVAAADPDNDNLRYVWELMTEPSVLGRGGSYEPRPDVLENITDGKRPMLELSAPAQSGEYRLFVYVLDENGHVGTANVPFAVSPSHTLKAENRHSTTGNS